MAPLHLETTLTDWKKVYSITRGTGKNSEEYSLAYMEFYLLFSEEYSLAYMEFYLLFEATLMLLYRHRR